MISVLPESLKKLDASDMYGLIRGFPEQLEDAIEMAKNIQPRHRYSGVTGIVLAGMGGSAIAGDMAATLVARWLTVPWQVVRDYRMPPWVSENTLGIFLSYSGRTEETLSCLKDALNRGAAVAGVTSGGDLQESVSEGGGDLMKIPSGYPPRAALGYLCIPVVYFLHRIGLVRESLDGQLRGAVSYLKTLREQFSQAEQTNPAYSIARSIYTSIPVIYGGDGITAPAALRWRGQLGENGKILAFHHHLPEMNHNEIVGYENNPDLVGRLCVLWLMDRNDHSQIRKRQRLTRGIIGSRVEQQIDIEAEGANSVERLFYLIHLGDWVSFWVAMHHGTDPTPVSKIDRLKLSLSRQN